MTIIALWELNVNYVLIGYTVFGLTGDYVALAMAIFVYTADNTTKGKNRSFLMVAAQVSIRDQKGKGKGKNSFLFKMVSKVKKTVLTTH